MGKKEAASRSSKRKSDQTVAEPELNERKKAKKETVEAAQQPKAKQKKDQKPAKKKAARKPDTEPKPKSKSESKSRKSRAKKQQQQQELEQEAEEQVEQEEPEMSVHDTFMEEVHAKEAELQKHCLIMEQVETEEDETTLEQLRALKRVFVPQKVQDDFMEVWEELDEVGQDSDDEDEEGAEEGNGEQDDQPDILGAIMKAILGGKMLNTKHSSQMHTILKSHQEQIDKAIKSKSWQEAFCRWAATLMASHREKHWYEDTDMPEDAEAIYKKMRQQWLKLKARSDEELGGLVAEGDKSAKEEFDAYLQAVADDMRTMDYAVQDVAG